MEMNVRTPNVILNLLTGWATHSSEKLLPQIPWVERTFGQNRSIFPAFPSRHVPQTSQIIQDLKLNDLPFHILKYNIYLSNNRNFSSCFTVCTFHRHSKPNRLGKYCSNSFKWPMWRTIILFYKTFITVLYTFRATSCSSSVSQIVLIQHLVQSLSVSGRPVCKSSSCSACIPDGHLQRVTIPDAVLIQFDLWWCARRCSKHVED